MNRSAQTILRALPTVFASLTLAGCSLFGVRAGYEQPPYAVEKTLPGGVEIRRYEARLAAETTVTTTNRQDGQSAAFRVLAAYIFGDNRSQTEVSRQAMAEARALPRRRADPDGHEPRGERHPAFRRRAQELDVRRHRARCRGQREPLQPGANRKDERPPRYPRPRRWKRSKPSSRIDSPPNASPRSRRTHFAKRLQTLRSLRQSASAREVRPGLRVVL
jgi:hypothetical protein